MVGDNKSDALHDFCAGFVFDCHNDSSDKNCDDQCSQAEELLSCLLACLTACTNQVALSDTRKFTVSFQMCL